MRHRERLIGFFLIGLMALRASFPVPAASAVAPAETGTLTITLEAGGYALREGSGGETQIQMEEDFGSFGAPGEPGLPGRVFLIALPPGAQVSDVHFATPDSVLLPGRYQVAPVGPAVGDPGEAPRSAERTEQVYSSDAPYPGQVGKYLGQDQWRRYTYARVAFQPFSYWPLSGALRFYPALVVTIEYRLPEPGSPAWREVERLRDDRVLDDVIAPYLVNFDQAQAWYDGWLPLVTAASQYDYVIVVQNATMATAVAPFKTWKESLGHTVNVVTLDWVNANYSGADVAERVWNMLHAKYPASAWGIRYVLLVGNLQIIPNRLLFYSNPPKEWGLQSDHFYAKLGGGDTSAQVWNHDGDRRWGEIDGDEMSVVPDVLVGRIPLNDTTSVGKALQAMIKFEQDGDLWKHKALLAGGYNDIASAALKTDNAVLMEYIRNQLLTPNGWEYTRIYEQSGLGTSTYTPSPNYDTSRTNVVTAWNGSAHGLAIFADHGNSDGLSGHVWQNDTLTTTNQVDEGEWVWSDLFTIDDVATLTTTYPSIVELLGCATMGLTTAPWPTQTVDLHGTPTQPGGYGENTGSRLLARGAAAGVVGFDSPIPYRQYWTAPPSFGSQTAGTYFTENLVKNRYTLGWSLYEAKIRYTSNYYQAGAYEPIPWAFTLFGDPSMVLEGYDTSAKGTNRTIHSGAVYGYGTDNADNGDMYVAVITSPDTHDGEIKVYKSTNHGDTWSPWATVMHSKGFDAVDVLVGEWGSDEFAERKLHVFASATDGRVYDNRIDLATATGTSVLISNEGSASQVTHISAARDPVPITFGLYVTWDVTSGTSHQVKVARSTSNGVSWTSQFTFDGYQQPHIDAGPAGSANHVYLAAVGNSFPYDVYVTRSTDRGANWGSWTNLTSGDSANYHGTPAVASSTDAAIPTVWVAYDYYKTVTYGGADLYFAYFTDGGNNWTRNRILSAEQGFDELSPDMVGHRGGPSRWMNIAYDHSQSARHNVVWRWANGSTPGAWQAPRLVNDYNTHPAIGPQVIYSPGVAATGSGVVYPGTGSPVTNLYFAAPWLTSTTSLAARSPAPPPAPEWNADHRMGTDRSVAVPYSPASSPALGGQQSAVPLQEPYWAFTGRVGQAFRVAGLARHPDGTLYAAATTGDVDLANTGTVFRSGDGGRTWEPLPELPLAWWLDSILVTDAGTLLAGGTLYEYHNPDAHPHGAIYRSEDGGQHWSVVAERPDTGAVLALLQRANGDAVAGAGPGGTTLVSPDDGQTWQPLGTPPSARRVYALLETAEGSLYAGGERTGGTGAIYRLGSGGWETVEVLDNPAAVYALLEDDHQVLYAGVAFTDHTGRVLRSSNDGQDWEPSAPLGQSQAVRTLLEGPEGRLCAGVDMGPGPFTSYVYSSADGGQTWQDGGFLYMADAVYDLLLAPEDTIYAASGDTYGVIFRSELSGTGGYRVYLPLTLRNAQ